MKRYLILGLTAAVCLAQMILIAIFLFPHEKSVFSLVLKGAFFFLVSWGDILIFMMVSQHLKKGT